MRAPPCKDTFPCAQLEIWKSRTGFANLAQVLQISHRFIHKIGDHGLKTVNIDKYGNLEIWNPKILFWEGVMVLYKLFTESVLWGSKRSKSTNMEIWKCGILKSYFGKVSFFLCKLFTKSVMGVRHGQHRKNLEFWNPKILCWEGVMFFYDLFTKSVIWVSKRLK